MFLSSLLFFLPLDKSLVLASDGKEALIVGSESCAHHMLTVTCITGGDVSIVDAGVVPHVD